MFIKSIAPFSSRLEISLPQIESNFSTMLNFAPKGTKGLAVIKANGYGHGAVAIARQLTQADYVAVATVSEAIELRQAGILTPILIFSAPVKSTVSFYKSFDLTAVISDVSHFSLLESGTKAHIQFDTGMYRFGILPQFIGEVKKQIKTTSLAILGVMTHFAKSGDPDDPSVTQQLAVFDELRNELPSDWITHVANTGGIAFYPESHKDMVRIGISLYGYSPGETPISGIKPACRWLTEVIQVKPVQKGVGIGYNWTFGTPENGFVHVIPVGYADGYVRGLGNKICVKIGDELVRVVGRITMDYALLFSEKEFKVGTEVEIMGDGPHSAAHWASELGTIPYEMLTRMGERRVERVYIT